MPYVMGKFRVIGKRSQETEDHVYEVLAMADNFRQELANSYYSEFVARIGFRNHHFPDLYEALRQKEFASARCSRIDGWIRRHHSNVRDRNAVTDAQRAALESARRWQAAAKRTARDYSNQWFRFLRAARAAFNATNNWKNIKSLDRRRELYALVTQWPDYLVEAERRAREATQNPDQEEAAKAQRYYDRVNWDADPALIETYMSEWMATDLTRRELFRRYQGLGLHSAIRGEIVEATQPQTDDDSPGMKYVYGREPRPRPWNLISLQFAGGVSFRRVLSGNFSHLSMTPLYTNHKASGDVTVYDVGMSIGTRQHPRRINYKLKMHVPANDDQVLKRWTLKVDPQPRGIPGARFQPERKWWGLPVVEDTLCKQQGDGVLCYELSWAQTSNGVLVATFRSPHVNERLVLPQWLVSRRMQMADVQQAADNCANNILTDRGVEISQRPGRNAIFGVSALERYVENHPDDVDAAARVDELNGNIVRTLREVSQAVRAIESIYKTVVRRVCRLHSEIVPDNLRLATAKRYDTRDLLEQDALPRQSRELRQAVSPGKLKAWLLGYGLARAEAPPENPVVSRETDLFTSYINGLGQSTGPLDPGERRYSRHQPEEGTT